MIGLENEAIKPKKGSISIVLFSYRDNLEGVTENHSPGPRKDN